MSDIFADDLFEIYGTQIPISSITDYRLRNIEYIMRPIYQQLSFKKPGLIRDKVVSNYVFDQMEYYAAIIGEERFINTVEDEITANPLGAVAKQVNVGLSDAVSIFKREPTSKRKRYRMMNAAGRVFISTLDDIPAVCIRADGKMSEIYPDDELHTKIGESITPTIVLIPALCISTKKGSYIFFGEGINVPDINLEYERLKTVIRGLKVLKKAKVDTGPNLVKNGTGFINSILQQFPSVPHISLPFPKKGEDEESAKK